MQSDRNPDDRAGRLEKQLTEALDALERARPLAKALHQSPVHTLTLQLLKEPRGIDVLYRQAPRFDPAGLFHGSDWTYPIALDPLLVRGAIRSGGNALAVECLSAMRMLAIANGDTPHPHLPAEQGRQEARRFLERVLAMNLDLVFPESSEASRAEDSPQMQGVQRMFRFIADHVGLQGVLVGIVDEIERLLSQRPILVHRIVAMIRTAAQALSQQEAGELHDRALRLVRAVDGPTELCRSCSSPDEYRQALEGLDENALRDEAKACGSSMWVTGLVCPQHAALLQYLNHAGHADLVIVALGLGEVGRTSMNLREDLVRRLIEMAIDPALPQSVYGLASTLECGILFFPPVVPELLRLTHLPMHPAVVDTLRQAIPGTEHLTPQAVLVAGMLNVLGQPLGVGQGDNPTCQSARAISLWAQIDPGFLLEFTAQAARDNEVVHHFEGQPLATGALQEGMAGTLHTELDPVSLVLVPHLDRIYAEMSRRVVGRGEDGHKWINPELHGWWVDRGFASTIQFATGAVVGYTDFIRLFYATYHPHYRGPAELTYPQPAGIAATSPVGDFLGWHAITIQRIAPDPEGTMRVYFYNPNNDSGQNWGHGIVTSTAGHGELFGEASLPFEQFAARLYVFHHNTREHGDPQQAPEQQVQQIAEIARSSWARRMEWADPPPA